LRVRGDARISSTTPSARCISTGIIFSQRATHLHLMRMSRPVPTQDLSVAQFLGFKLRAKGIKAERRSISKYANSSESSSGNARPRSRGRETHLGSLFRGHLVGRDDIPISSTSARLSFPSHDPNTKFKLISLHLHHTKTTSNTAANTTTKRP
jgi:hypothetical protein